MVTTRVLNRLQLLEICYIAILEVFGVDLRPFFLLIEGLNGGSRLGGSIFAHYLHSIRYYALYVFRQCWAEKYKLIN